MPCQLIPVPDSPPSRPTSSTSLALSPLTTASIPTRRFPTSGCRSAPPGTEGRVCELSFNDDHIAATTQAICDYRARAGTDGPLFLARDTHALSEPAWVTAVEVLAANDVTVLVDSRDGYTPTPALSHAVLAHNRAPVRESGVADGIVVTPSHNPPSDGGFKYNPPDGGPAGTEVTTAIQDRANALLGERPARGSTDPHCPGPDRGHDPCL